MDDYRFWGTVYVLVNSEANRVKVGMTTNDVGLRLDDINDLWTGRKVTCQVCGGRLVHHKGFVPLHVVSGQECMGGGASPLETDISFATSYLAMLRAKLNDYSGVEKLSTQRRIKTLEKRIALYKNFKRGAGRWEVALLFRTRSQEAVEATSHKILAEFLDKEAPFGEVFCCSVEVAANAVEKALDSLDLLSASIKQAFRN